MTRIVRLFRYLAGPARKAAVAELAVLGVLTTVLADGKISPAEWVALAVAQLGAIGVHQVTNGDAPPAELHRPLRVAHITERPSTPHRTGRHVEHDPRSRQFPVRELLDTAAPLISRTWPRHSPILDQGQVGSCTGNAAAGWAATDSAHRKGLAHITERIALELYTEATVLDSIPGTYPGQDTGSTGLAVAKALVKAGYATGYTHGFTLDDCLRAISQRGPVLIGLPWHHDSFTPDIDGILHITGAIDGGHEILAREIDVENKLVWIDNSWSVRWGVHGRAAFRWADLATLLKAGGDCTVPH